MPKRKYGGSTPSAKRRRRAPPARRRRPAFKSGRSRNAIAKICKSVIMKTAEPKHTNKDFGKFELYHNVYQSLQMNASSAMPAQGDSDSERVGDRIYSGGFLLRMLLGTKWDRPNVTFKYYVMWTRKQDTYVYNNFFDNVMNNVLLDSPNKDYVKVLKSGTISPTKATAFSDVTADINNLRTHEKTMPYKIWVPYKKMMKFGTDTTQVPQDGYLYFLIAPFDAYGTLITDNIAYVDCTSTFYYKDP